LKSCIAFSRNHFEITDMQDSEEQGHSLADVWRAAEQQRTEEIGGWIKSLFEDKEPKAASQPKPIRPGATGRLMEVCLAFSSAAIER
jgi:hypothetical protein